jgi:hypothetical protein
MVFPLDREKREMRKVQDRVVQGGTFTVGDAPEEMKLFL